MPFNPFNPGTWDGGASNSTYTPEYGQSCFPVKAEASTKSYEIGAFPSNVIGSYHKLGSIVRHISELTGYPDSPQEVGNKLDQRIGELCGANWDLLPFVDQSVGGVQKCVVREDRLSPGMRLRLPRSWIKEENVLPSPQSSQAESETDAWPVNYQTLPSRPGQSERISVPEQGGIMFDRTAASGLEDSGSVEEKDDDKNSFPWLPVLAVASLAGLGLWAMMGQKRK